MASSWFIIFNPLNFKNNVFHHILSVMHRGLAPYMHPPPFFFAGLNSQPANTLSYECPLALFSIKIIGQKDVEGWAAVLLRIHEVPGSNIWRRFVVVFFSSSRQMFEKYLNSGHDGFHFIIHLSLYHSTDSPSYWQLLSKPQYKLWKQGEGKYLQRDELAPFYPNISIY